MRIKNSILTWLIIGFIIMIIGIIAILTIKKNLINILMNIELALLGINFELVVLSEYLDDIMGQIFVLTILTVSAAEIAIALAILVMYFRRKGIITINIINYIKG